MNSSRMAVIASRVGADEKRLMAAFDRRGVRYDHLDTRCQWFDAPSGPSPWSLVVNREIGYHRALHAALCLEAGGARVVNSAHAIGVCGDKWRTTLALGAAGLPTPRTVLALTPAAALGALEALGYPAVLKPLVGSWGRLVTMVPDRQTAQVVLEYVAALPGPQSHIVYAQRYVANAGRDIRALVAGGEVVAAMYRISDGWRTNVALGGTGWYCELPAETAELAVAAARVVGATVAGVDLIEDAEGAAHVIEVNHRAEFAGLQAAAGDRIDVAARLVDVLLEADR